MKEKPAVPVGPNLLAYAAALIAVPLSLANDKHSAMVREILETVVPSLSRCLIPVVMAGALALALSACGRRGALDPPPGGYVLDSGTTRTPTTRRGLRREDEPRQVPEYDDEGRPVAAEGRKKRLPGDWLID
jgi:predicted small lipoprotein YifL